MDSKVTLIDVSGHVYDLDKEYHYIGRSKDNDIVLSGNPSVSRKHAIIYLKEGSWFISDLGSANGTGLNGKRVNGEAKLSANDVLTIGMGTFVFCPSQTDEEAATALIADHNCIASKPSPPSYFPGRRFLSDIASRIGRGNSFGGGEIIA